MGDRELGERPATWLWWPVLVLLGALAITAAVAVVINGAVLWALERAWQAIRHPGRRVAGGWQEGENGQK